jgi:hypothetical protein
MYISLPAATPLQGVNILQPMHRAAHGIPTQVLHVGEE